jgi:hypothetical protein
MACITANTADDACCVVLLLGAVVLAVSNLAAILARLVLVVTQRSVESRKFSELVSLKFILDFWSGSRLRLLAS